MELDTGLCLSRGAEKCRPPPCAIWIWMQVFYVTSFSTLNFIFTFISRTRPYVYPAFCFNFQFFIFDHRLHQIGGRSSFIYHFSTPFEARFHWREWDAELICIKPFEFQIRERRNSSNSEVRIRKFDVVVVVVSGCSQRCQVIVTRFVVVQIALVAGYVVHLSVCIFIDCIECFMDEWTMYKCDAYK